MFLVAYKVLGKELVSAVVGTFLLLIWICFFLWYIWKNTMPRSVLKEKQKDGTVLYEVINQEKGQYSENYACERLIATAIFAIGVLILLYNIF